MEMISISKNYYNELLTFKKIVKSDTDLNSQFEESLNDLKNLKVKKYTKNYFSNN
jgi:hypothetical protein